MFFQYIFLYLFYRITKSYLVSKGNEFTLEIQKPEADVTSDMLTR